MDTVTKEFIEHFHSLPGTTVGEKTRNLFFLIDHANNSVDTKLLQPQNVLEEKFKIEVLLRFNKFSELLDILKDRNRIWTNTILKNDKLIDEICTEVSAEDLIRIFGQMSFSTNLKIVNRLGRRLKNTEKADEYFGALLERYGLLFAAKILPCCSLELILKALRMYHVELTPRQLLTIVRRYPEAAEDILEKRNKKHTAYILTRSKDDLSLLLKLLSKYDRTNFRLGTKSTYKLLKQQEFFDNYKKFSDILKKQTVAKAYPHLFHILLPKTITEFAKSLLSYIACFIHLKSKPKQLQAVSNSFRKAYDSDLWDYSSLITIQLIEMMEREDRLSWIRTNSKPDNISEYAWISFFEIEESVPKLKEIISWTSNVKTRALLVGALVKTCQLNNDLNALEDVLQFIWDNHRRDHILVMQQFFASLTESFYWSKLEDKHWTILNKLIEALKGYGELGNIPMWKNAYIVHCLDQNTSVRNLLVDLSKSNNFNVCRCFPKYEKTCLELFPNVLNSTYKGKSLVLKQIQYTGSLLSWNRRHPQEKLQLLINAEIINHLKTTLTANYLHQEIASEYIIHYFDQARELLRPLLHSNVYYLQKILNLLLKNHPEIFLENLEQIVKCMVSNNLISPYIKQVSRYYTHLGIPQTMSEISAKLIQDEKSFAWAIYSATTPSSEILKHIPKNLKLKARRQDNWQQKCLRGTLHNVTLHEFAHFYTDLTQENLCFVADNISEGKVLEVLHQLDTPTALWFAMKTVNLKEIENVIAKTKNQKAVGLKGVFNIFLRNPQSDTWNALKDWVKHADVKDKKVLKLLTNCKKVSPEFFVRYFLLIWEIMDECPNKDTFLEKRMCNSLSRISEDAIENIPNDFCKEIIDRYFFQSDRLCDFQKSVIVFTSKYLLYKNREFLQNVFEKFKTHVESIQNDPQHYALIRSMLFYFVEQFCSYFLNGSFQSSLLEVFIKLWGDNFEPSLFYKEFLYLHFVLIAIDCSTPEDIGNCIVVLLDRVNVISIEFTQCYNLLKTYFLKHDPNWTTEEIELIIIETLARQKFNTSCLHFAVGILPSKDVMLTKRCKEKLRCITTLLEESNDSYVKSFLRDPLLDFFFF